MKKLLFIVLFFIGLNNTFAGNVVIDNPRVSILHTDNSYFYDLPLGDYQNLGNYYCDKLGYTYITHTATHIYYITGQATTDLLYFNGTSTYNGISNTYDSYIMTSITCNSTDVLGCTDINAINYNSLANIDDNSCQYNNTNSGSTSSGSSIVINNISDLQNYGINKKIFDENFIKSYYSFIFGLFSIVIVVFFILAILRLKK